MSLTIAGVLVIVLGFVMVLASLTVGKLADERSAGPPGRGRFGRDAALFGARVAGATLILFGAVLVIASRHAALATGALRAGGG